MIKEKVKALWRLCFNDDEAFIEMYFRLRYNNDVNIAITSGEEVIAALQMLPYPMTFCGKTIQTAYVSGACTHPDYQGNGVMRELLSQAFIRMLRNDAVISTLIPGEPWLFNYYTRMGYVPVFHCSKELISRMDTPASTNTTLAIEEVTEFDEAVYTYIDRQMKQRACCIQHTEADFKVILEDLGLTQNALYVAKEEERVTGVAFFSRQECAIQINELLADSEEVKQRLLHHIRQATESDAIALITPPTKSVQEYPIGMARIIDAKSVLQLYAATHPKEEMSIDLTDEQLSNNNGYYYVYNGKCMYNNERLPGTHQQLTIGELSQQILAPLSPYMSLMLN